MKSSIHQSLTKAGILLFLFVPGTAGAQQQDTTVLKRWVGNYLERPLTLEFYGDTMLVVGDQHALNYRMTFDSLIATGDTTLVARYRLVRDRLLLETPDMNVITMAPQQTLGRPLTGRWVGEVDSAGTTYPVELALNTSRTACWRKPPDGKWTMGEWDRQTRVVTLTWDNGEWDGRYDPQGNSLLLDPISDSTHTNTGPRGILHRVFRGAFAGVQCSGR
jgi:hypothetical protein